MRWRRCVCVRVCAPRCPSQNQPPTPQQVRAVTSTSTGAVYACKSISKLLALPDISPARAAAHIDNVKREVAVLRRLRGTLNVVALEGAYEDDDCAHIVMELCAGGELLHVISSRPHYGERAAASYMRAVLRTLAQCHAHRILHRDVKPGNFMLLSDAPDAPLKAVDFGLAAFFDPASLPRTDLGLEGTPWYMAPEVLSSKWAPPADVWAAGVMAYQLLSGRLPFDDRSNPAAPSLTAVWKAILTESPSFAGKTWADVSADAKDFVTLLLAKGAADRPTAAAALRHRWLVGDITERAAGKPLRSTVVQRIQRFGTANPLRRTIFELMAAELLRMAPPSPGESPGGSAHSSGGGGSGGGAPDPAAAAPASLSPGSGGGRGGMTRSVSSGGLLRALRASADGPPSPLPADAARLTGVQSAHGARDYWRLMRAAAAASRLGAAAAAGGVAPAAAGDGSAHDGDAYLRTAPRGPAERAEARKAARLALDTSEHGGADYARLVRAFSERGTEGGGRGGSLRAAEAAAAALFHKRAGGFDGTGAHGATPPPAPSSGAAQGLSPPQPRPWTAVAPPPLSPGSAAEVGGRAQGAYAAFLAAGGVPPSFPPTAMQLDAAASPQAQARASIDSHRPSFESGADSPSGGCPAHRHVSFAMDVDAAPVASGSGAQPPPASRSAPVAVPTAAAAAAAEAVSFAELRDVMRRLNFSAGDEAVTEDALADGLARLGYRLAPGEGRLLAQQVAGDGGATGGQPALVSRPAFVASQMDWGTLAVNHRDAWLAAAEKVFGGLGSGASGGVSTAALVAALRDKLPAAEVEHAVEDALLDAGIADAEGLDFEGFLKLVAAGGSVHGGGAPGAGASVHGGLDAYESRLATSARSGGLLAAATAADAARRRPSVEGSHHGGGLAPVQEEKRSAAPE